MNKSCQNCARELQPDYAFCPGCSQKADLHRLNIHQVVHDGIHYFTHADKGIFQLVRDLAVKGGTVAREFIEGKRKKHFPPLNFFLIVTALNLIAVNLDGAIEIMPIEELFPNIATITDPEALNLMNGAYGRYVKAMHFIGERANITAIFSLPLIAFVFYLFYRKKGYNYVEHVFAGMYMYGFTMLFFVVMAMLNYFLRLNVNVIYFVVIAFQLVYFTMFYREMMYRQSTRRAVVASIAALGTIFLVYGIVVMLYVAGLLGG